MLTLIKRAESEIVVKKSRFIAIALPCSKMEDVKVILNQVRKEHESATHVVHAAVIGKNGTLYSSSDDREPKNTAGRPALEVLKGSGITNIMVCIVRYFGGTLLGTGGLVKAYGDAVKAVLEVTQTDELIDKKTVTLILSYDYYTQLKRIFDSYSVEIKDETFDINIKTSVIVREDKLEDFLNEVKELGQGRIVISQQD